ncbi:MAG: hypothetical protein ACE5JU_23105 [Candidatus Binatia bacterium]
MKKESIVPFVWGVVVGAVALLIVIFWAGWVVTTSSAQATAEEMAEEAVVDRLAPICVAQFRQEPDAAKKLKQLKDTDSWDRGKRIMEWGFATMPGEKTPDSKVAEKCAEELLM